MANSTIWEDRSMIHEALAKFDKTVAMKKRYDNFIGGK